MTDTGAVWLMFMAACETEAAADWDLFHSSLWALWGSWRDVDQPFRDLLAAIDAATRHTPITGFDRTQREALGNAIAALGLGPDYAVVEAYLCRFADLGIDTTGPIRPRLGR